MSIKKEQQLFPWLRPKLRRLSYMWPERKDAKINARVSRGQYECAHCKEEGITELWGPKEFSLDHVEPVIPTTINPDSEYLYNILKDNPKILQIFQCKESDLKDLIKTFIFISRLFCKAKGFQVLCHEHHDIKTFLENELRNKT